MRVREMNRKQNEEQGENPAKITEDEIKRKLYGEFPRDKAKKSPIRVRGETPGEPSGENKTKPEKEIEKPGKAAPAKINPDIQDEIDALKESIFSLEEKLKQSESRKERLKVRLIQKRKLVGFQERFLDLVFNKLPEKMLILVAGVIIILVLALILGHRGKKPSSSPASVRPAEQTQAKQESEQVKFVPAPAAEAGSKYTVQVAEYADVKAANDFIKKLKDKNFDVHVATSYRGDNLDKPYFKISVGSFDTFQDAKNYMEKVRKELKIRDSFIKENRAN